MAMQKRVRQPTFHFEGRHLRWTELSLLILPSLFLLVGLYELLLLPKLSVPISSKNLPPLDAFIPAIGLIVTLIVAHIALTIIALDVDQTLLPIAGMLSSIGVLMALRLGPDLGQDSLGSKQLIWVMGGMVLCVMTVFFTKDLTWLRKYKYTWAFLGIVLVGITLVRAHSFSANAPSRDVLSIGPGGLSFQPSEILKICLVVFFAGYLSENREMLASASYQLGPIKLPPLKHLGPLLGMLGIALAIFMVVRELGLAILIFGLFLAMLYVASNRPAYVIWSTSIFAVGAFIVYRLFPYARTRISLVANAFQSDPAHPDNPATNIIRYAGYQIVQGLVALSAGGVFGAGLGLGKPYLVPASNTDFIATSFGEEFGFAGLLALIGLFMLLIYRGMRIAVMNRGVFEQLLAVGLTSVFALQTMVILAGNLKLMPLTGVPLPFVAYGGSSVIANFIIIGLLLRLSRTSS